MEKYGKILRKRKEKMQKSVSINEKVLAHSRKVCYTEYEQWGAFCFWDTKCALILITLSFVQ